MTRSLDQGEAHDAPSQDNKRSSPGTGDSAIHPFFQLKRPRTNSGQAQASAGLQWREIGRTWIGCYKEQKPAARFAAFDLDNTLICVKGKYKFPKDSDDWVFLHPDVPRLLRNMHGQGYKIVIISNQNGLKPAKNSTKLTKSAVDYRLKISKIAEQLDVPFTILAATDKDYMRKPSPGMWHLAELDNGGLSVDRSSSFFVGDAAGRKAGWKRGAAADFSDSDLAFALNLNVPFYTPEHIFIKGVLDKDTPLPLPPAEALPISRFVPAKSSFDSKAHEQVLEALSAKTSRAPGENKRLLVMLVGPPASGKSTFAIRTLEPRGFVRINMDALKTKKKCENAVREALSADKHVVVDNTNPDPSTRRPYLDIAKELGAERICVAFEHGSRNLAIHNNRFRSMLAQAQYLTDHKHERSLHGVPAVADRIPDVAYNTYFKKFAPPAASEGFSDILQHAFVPSFESPADERIWYQYF